MKQRPKKISLSDVRNSFNRDVKNQFIVTWFGRPLANQLTPAFYNTGWTANGVTMARAMIAAICVVALVLPGTAGAITACLGFYICLVLDCVDGNLARLSGTVTYWGKFIDGLADLIYVLGTPLAAGVGMFLAGQDPMWILGGSFITVASLTSQMARSRLSFFREWMVGQSGPLSNEVVRRADGSRRVQSLAASVYVNGRFLMPLLFLVPDYGKAAYIVSGLGLIAAPEIIWLCATIAEGRIILDRSRRSIHSPPDQSSE